MRPFWQGKAMAIFSRRSLQRMIVTVSHSGLEDENPIDVFQAELIRHIRKRHVLPNRFSCRINGVFDGSYGDRKLRLLLPSKSRLEAFFGKQFDEFLKKVAGLPEEQHSYTQKTEQVDIQIHYHPQQKYFSFGYPSYTNADSLSTLNLDR